MTFTVTDPNGIEHKRNSATKTYTHAVVAMGVNGYFVIGWASSLELAEKLLRTTQSARYPHTHRKLIHSDVTLLNAA